MVFLRVCFCLYVLDVGPMAMGAEPCTKADDIMKDTCRDAGEGTSFLQTSKLGTKGRDKTKAQSNRAPGLLTGDAKVKPFDCAKHQKPIQIIGGKTGYDFKKLNVETGVYDFLFAVPFKSVQPVPYKQLNGCGINPMDSIAYCVMKQGENYIVRLDEKTVEYVVKIPGWDNYNTGTFGPDGTYYVANGGAAFFVIKDLHKLPGYGFKKDKGILNKQSAGRSKPKNFVSSADVVAVKADLEGLGEKEYLISVNKKKVSIAAVVDGKFGKTWVFDYSCKPKNCFTSDVMGAGWSFNGKIFFAHNEGKGVFQVNLTALGERMVQINTGKAAGLPPFPLKLIGKSERTFLNDGANCMNMPDPWVTDSIPFDCKSNGEPIQVLRNMSWGYAVKKLDMFSGSYTPIFNLPFKKTTPPFKYLNAVGINPIDAIPYGCLMFDEFPGNFYIVRFDSKQFEYLLKVEGSYDPIAGTFNSKGDYFFMHTPLSGENPILFSMPALDTMKGFLNFADPKLPVKKKISGLTLNNFTQVADIVPVKYDLEGGGATTEYIMGMNRDEQVMFVKWLGTDGSKSLVWRFTTQDVLGTASTPWGAAYENFGAAWNYKGRIFFSSNDGVGVWETSKVDLAKKKIFLKRVGNSARVNNNDGFNCWNIDLPTAGASNVSVISAFAD